MNRTPLADVHARLGAKLVEFARWEMPIQYQGVIAESEAVRSSAGMFDVSHMGRTWHRGDGAKEFLELITTNDVGDLERGGSQYSMMCYETGGVVDDIIVYRLEDDDYGVVFNASNRDKDLAWMRDHNTFDVRIEDETFETAMIAVQGPKAVEIVDGLSTDDVETIERFTAKTVSIAGADCFCARTGYTGEDGVELILPADGAEKVWGAILDNGVVPCGLAARDVLRVEAGLPLYGHELSEDINPIEAGLGWVCSKSKSFIGSGPINDMRENKPERKLVGVRMNSRVIPREGYEIRKGGRPIGRVSSGVFSPALGCGIAFAFVDSSAAGLDEPCEVVIRDKPHEATMVNKRFLT